MSKVTSVPMHKDMAYARAKGETDLFDCGELPGAR